MKKIFSPKFYFDSLKNFFKYSADHAGKILIFNLLAMCLIVVIIEFVCAVLLYIEFNGEMKLSIIRHTSNFFHTYYPRAFNVDKHREKYFIREDFRFPAGLQYIKNTLPRQNSAVSDYKPPIVLIGDSFTYGKFLENNEAFHSVLSAATHRTVFNIGLNGGSPREMLYILRNDELRNILLRSDNEAEYVIYTYIFDHKKRLFLNYRYKVPHFKIKKNSGIKHLEYIKPIYNSYAYSYFRVYSKLLEKSLQDLLYLYIDEIHSEVKKHFSYGGKPAKFVILVYEDDGTIDWEKIRQKGIIVINPHDILDIDIDEPEYRFPDSHPNANAWQNIVPALVKELNLI